MIRNVSIALAAAFAVGLWALPNVVSAQEENQKRENVDYFQVIHLNFKPGHNTDAWSILYTKIGPAVRSTGREFIALDWESGPWDSSIYIRLDDGYGTLDYAATPQFLEFRAALAAEEGGGGEAELTPERFAEFGAKEQFVLTVSEKGYGKRSSSYEYRTSGRGGKGIVAMVVNERNGPLVASFPVADSDQIMLVTDGGQLIRCPVNDVRIAGRNTQGVTIFNTDKDERVVSVEHIPDEGDDDADLGDDDADLGDNDADIGDDDTDIGDDDADIGDNDGEKPSTE